MKIAMTALAVVFLAQATPSLAQPGERDRVERAEPDQEQPREPRPFERQQGDSRQGGERGDWTSRRGVDAPVAPPAAEAPQAPQATEGRGRVPGDSIGRPGPWTPDAGRDTASQDRGRNRDGDRHEGQRGDGRRDDHRRGDGWRRGDDRRDGNDHRRDDRRDWDRRDWGHRDGRQDDHRRWERGRYPSAYFSSNRYRHAWRPPSGFYVRSWGFGEILPRGWYGSGYWITDPWRFGLPLPPPGYDWVRAGDDALLIDQYTGRVVQVVRNLFW